jgi:hypothetical protein
MSQTEAVWKRKSDGEIVAAAASLDEYTDDARRIILEEAERRGLNVTPLVRAATDYTPRPASLRRCAYCETRILFGGKRHGDVRFCNETCYQAGIRLFASHSLRDEAVTQRVWALFNGPCPQCGGPGPVDVHVSHRIVSAVLFSSWSNRPALTCRACARTARMRDAAVSLGLGWWALPWGVIMTPVQIARNVAGLLHRPLTDQPSAQLEKLVRLQLIGVTLVAPRDRAGEL